MRFLLVLNVRTKTCIHFTIAIFAEQSRSPITVPAKSSSRPIPVPAKKFQSRSTTESNREHFVRTRVVPKLVATLPILKHLPHRPVLAVFVNFNLAVLATCWEVLAFHTVLSSLSFFSPSTIIYSPSFFQQIFLDILCPLSFPLLAFQW